MAFKDNPARALRYSAGDIAPLQARLAGQTDMLGLSIERNYAALQPLRNVRSTGRRSLLLQRRSTVEVYVNGALVQTFVADPGPIDIRDIPLADISSDVSIVVEDDLGRREMESFSAGADLSLLAEGVSEFNASIGVLRDGYAGDFTYSSDPIVSLFYARGLRQDLTIAGHAVLTTSLQNIGIAAAWARMEGIAQFESALSQSDDGGAGVALGLSYRGDPFGQAERDGLLNLRVEHRTSGFREAVGAGFSDSLKLDVAADYRIRLTDRATANAGAAYFTSHGERTSQSASAGLAYDWGLLTSSATVRYSKDRVRGDEVGVFLSVSMPFGARSYGYASHDTVTETTRAEYRRIGALNQVGDVIVTGSRIRGVAPVGSSLVSLGREEIASSGTTTTAELLKQIPQITAIGFNAEGSTGPAAASNITRATGPNLRGIGPTATLTLLDGHRVSAAGTQGQVVDPSFIPPLALERVEVIADGASAIYGSDAVGWRRQPDPTQEFQRFRGLVAHRDGRGL